jgi:hypothetical protein
MPARFDEGLNKEVVAIFQKSPLFLLSFGFWMLTNFNIIPYKGAKANEIESFSHYKMIYKNKV